VAGFGSFMVATFLIALAYVSLMLCSAELSSALPFAGTEHALLRFVVAERTLKWIWRFNS
jgi:hypothetical protein